MTTRLVLKVACLLIGAVSVTACAPPTPKVERAGPPAGLEQRPQVPAAHSEGSIDR